MQQFRELWDRMENKVFVDELLLFWTLSPPQKLRDLSPFLINEGDRHNFLFSGNRLTVYFLKFKTMIQILIDDSTTVGWSFEVDLRENKKDWNCF